MRKVKFNFKALEKEINYLAMWPNYYGENGELMNFDVEDEKGNVSLDEWPMTISELEKKGFKYRGSVYNCSSEYGDEEKEPHFDYIFSPEDNEIEVVGETFTMKECLVIINMVMKQLEDKKHSYGVAYGFDEDYEFQFMHQDASHFGWWWDSFIKFFEGRQSDIKYIRLQMQSEKSTVDEKDEYPVVVIVFDYKNPYEKHNRN